MVEISPLPGAPTGVRGAINVHGEPVPVLDLDVRIGREPRERGTSAKLLIARTATRRVALPVDEVLGVLAVPRGAIGPAPDASRRRSRDRGAPGRRTADLRRGRVPLRGGRAGRHGGAAVILAEARALVSERLGLAFPSRRGDDLQQAFAERSLATLREAPTTAPEWRSLIAGLTVRESYFFRESAELERRSPRSSPSGARRAG